jgi:hypothetical protein
MQIEVYLTYQCRWKENGKDHCEESESLCPPGKNIDLPLNEGEKKHDHEHVTATPYKPSLLVDHGGSTDAFSKGPYAALEGSTDTVNYEDHPTAATALYSRASQEAINARGQTKIIDRRTYTIFSVTVVQRFITTVYVDQKPVATVHWTSTATKKEGLPDVAIISLQEGNLDPAQVVKDWAIKKDE